MFISTTKIIKNKLGLKKRERVIKSLRFTLAPLMNYSMSSVPVTLC